MLMVFLHCIRASLIAQLIEPYSTGDPYLILGQNPLEKGQAAYSSILEGGGEEAFMAPAGKESTLQCGRPRFGPWLKKNVYFLANENF